MVSGLQVLILTMAPMSPAPAWHRQCLETPGAWGRGLASPGDAPTWRPASSSPPLPGPPASPPSWPAASTGDSPHQSPGHRDSGKKSFLKSPHLVIILQVMEELPEVVTHGLTAAPLTLALQVQGVQPHVLQGKMSGSPFKYVGNKPGIFYCARPRGLFCGQAPLYSGTVSDSALWVFFVCRGLSGYVDTRTFWLLSLSAKGWRVNVNNKRRV